MILDPAVFRTMVAEANLAPSVHNTQPTRWRQEADGAVTVLEDTSRRLPVGDPQGRDASVSHGAAIEGFALAAGARGWSVAVEPLGVDGEAALRLMARLRLADGGATDPLHGHVATRRTYRGRFAAGGDLTALAPLEAAGDLRLVSDREGLARLAALNDVASLRTFRNGAYRAELLSWMRLSRRHPRWAIDGLNREAMAMSPVEATGAGLVLRPGVFEALDRIGLAAPLTGEAAVVRSALAVVLFHRPNGEAPLLTGRRFYRLWLEFTAAGLAAAPMAVMADDPDCRAEVAEAFNLPVAQRLITAFRVGISPATDRLSRPRLLVTHLVAS